MTPHRVEKIAVGTKSVAAKFVVLTKFADGKEYVYRYAYDEEARAKEVAANLTNGNSNCDDETTIAFNYWRWTLPRRAQMEYIQRTTQKHSWYISNPAGLDATTSKKCG